MAQSLKDSKDYPSEACEQSRDRKDGQKNCPVSSSTPWSNKLSSTTSSSSSESSLAFSDAFDLPPAPDGGWGWFVVLGAFFLSLICDGCAFSFGVFFVHLIDEFKQTKSETAWVASIFYCLSLLLGPVASAITTRFGCRSATIVAGLLSCVGFVASAFVTSIWQLYFTFGVIVGASFSVCYVSSVLTVAFYFDKRRALATGLSVCGTGIGTFTFAPLCDVLVGMYGWRGAFLILGAISLNICVCGALFRPLTFTPEQRRQRHLNAFDRLTRPISRLSIPSRNRSRLHSTNSESSSSSTSDSEDDLAALAYSQVTLPTYVNADKETIKIYLDKLPELRRSNANPQLALQRFFKSKDVGMAGRSPGHQAKVEYSAQTSVKREDGEGDSVGVQLESRGKRRKQKNWTKGKDDTSRNKTLSEKSMQQLTEKLLENTADTESVDKHHSCRQCDNAENQLQSHDIPGRALERTQSEKTPGKLQCKMQPGSALGRSVSEKLPAKLQCQGDSGAVLECFMAQKTATEHRGKVTSGATAVHSSGVDPTLSSGSDMGMLLMNKHSTYLILHRNDIFFRGSRAQQRVPCATSCPELSRLPSSDSESDDENCMVDQCPCLEPVIDSMEGTFDKKIMSHPLFVLLALSNFLLYFWADVPYVFATDFALSRGIPDSDATFLISVIGIVNTVGQVSDAVQYSTVYFIGGVDGW